MAGPPPYTDQYSYSPTGQYPPAGHSPPAQPSYLPPQEKGGMPQGYPQQQHQQVQNSTTIITAQPAVIVGSLIMFNEYPVSLTCPSCKSSSSI